MTFLSHLWPTIWCTLFEVSESNRVHNHEAEDERALGLAGALS